MRDHGEDMNTKSIRIFFYGLFMDESLLASKNVRPAESCIGYVDGFSLHIGRRATLLPEAGGRAYGVLMKITQEEAVKILEEVHKKGLVHCAFFKKDLGRRFVAICNCCSCCCQGMKAWNMFQGAIPVLAPSGYVADISSECSACGECVEACQFEAISMDGDGQEAVVNRDKCMGCGVCEDLCPSQAIVLQRDSAKGEPLDLAELMKA